MYTLLETFPKMEGFPPGRWGTKSPFSIRDTYWCFSMIEHMASVELTTKAAAELWCSPKAPKGQHGKFSSTSLVDEWGKLLIPTRLRRTWHKRNCAYLIGFTLQKYFFDIFQLLRKFHWPFVGYINSFVHLFQQLPSFSWCFWLLWQFSWPFWASFTSHMHRDSLVHVNGDIEISCKYLQSPRHKYRPADGSTLRDWHLQVRHFWDKIRRILPFADFVYFSHWITLLFWKKIYNPFKASEVHWNQVSTVSWQCEC